MADSNDAREPQSPDRVPAFASGAGTGDPGRTLNTSTGSCRSGGASGVTASRGEATISPTGKATRWPLLGRVVPTRMVARAVMLQESGAGSHQVAPPKPLEDSHADHSHSG